MNSPLPFLKWPGGKRWLVKTIQSITSGVPSRCYFEPFLGGGSIFFGLQPKVATLSDINPDLINTYIQVRDHPSELVLKLKELPISEFAYYKMRDSRPDSDIDRAVRFLYLNRTCFGGLYRTNRNGEFNVPYGGGSRTHALLWERDLIQQASACLANTELVCSDFESSLLSAGVGDLVYCDPTYTVAHNNNSFVRYNERIFSWNDQIRLSELAREASLRGACVIVSNAYHESILNLYSESKILKVTRQSTVSSKISGRKKVDEVVIIV